ncbi:hypothetical protein [Psychromonas aquimarina]|uniref:hypothetical protein n=1 Tax=Psychromonas aquimarina TaxID=444919 RepID=UPI0004281FED|nr:hypothetical protein [Psychromonas aquimarina]
MNIESNANNFIEHLTSGVDVRTGMYSITIPLARLLSHNLSGPSIPIALSYSAGSSEDIGFGRGWSLSLSQYNETSETINLSTGQSFRIYKPWSSNEYEIPYRKIKDIKITYLSESEELKVVNKEGGYECLSETTGRLNKIVSPDGKEVYFSYDSWTGRINRIYDNAGREILFDWSQESDKVDIIHKHNELTLQTITLNKGGNGSYRRLSSINLDEKFPSIELDYRYIESSNYDVIEKVTHPSGLIEEMWYLDNGHSLPSGSPLSEIPFIQTHRVTPAFDSSQPVQLTEYDYSDKNYLGFASERVWIQGEDTLFKSSANYTYTTTEIINNSKKIVRSYNKYHLLDFEKRYDNNVLYRKDQYEYYAVLNKSIEEQPATYSLPKMQTTTHYYDGNSRSLTKQYEYDDYANPTLIQEVDGSKQIYIYYPPEGEEGACPANPYGMVSQLKEERFIPATVQYGEPPLITKYTYTSLARLDEPNQYFIVLATESDENQKDTLSYYTNSEQPRLYGQIKELVSSVNGYEQKVRTNYELLTDRLKTTTTALAHDGLTKTSSVSIDYLLGLPIEKVTEGESSIRITYDSLGRKKTITVAPDTDYMATTSFHYTVGDGNNTVTQTDPKGNIEVTKYNNAGKTIAIIQSHGNALYTVQSMTYNEYGQLKSTVDTDWLNGDKISITTEFKYDVNGEVKEIYHQDGRQEIIEQNPVSLTTEHKQVGLLTETTTYNLSGLEVEKETTDITGNRLARTQYHYDAFGKLRSIINTQGQITKYRYDVFDRLKEVERVIDGQSVVESYSYPEFTSESLVDSVMVNGVTLGDRNYDGLGRLMSETVNGAVNSYHYTGASNQPSSAILSNSSVIDMVNNANLQVTEAVSVQGKPELSSNYSFDPQTALPISNLNQGCRRTVTRDSYGRIEIDEVELNDGEIRQASEEYSLRGRLLKSRDYFGNHNEYGYDTLGRPDFITEYVSGVETKTHIEYDNYSRARRYTTERGADTAVIELIFNNIGIETQRVAKFNGVEEFSILQTYNSNLQLDKRVYTDVLGTTDETFVYDELARLKTYSCTGPNMPSNEYGEHLIQQVFSHDLYGNITEVISHFNDGTTNTTEYTYNPTNPVQLVRVTNTHNSYPSSVELNYDVAGNMLNDEKGNVYRYNELGQLTSVDNANGKKLSKYQYDGEGQMVSQTVEEQLVYLFYSKGTLVNEMSEETHSSYHHIAPGLVGRSIHDDANNVHHQLLLGNSQGSVLESLSTSEDSDIRDKKTRSYTPYGEG